MQSDRLFAPHCLTGIGETPVWSFVELMRSGADPVNVWVGQASVSSVGYWARRSGGFIKPSGCRSSHRSVASPNGVWHAFAARQVGCRQPVHWPMTTLC
jgi:hypothetical protein